MFEAVSEKLNATPTVPAAVAAHEMTGGGLVAAIVSVSVAVPVPPPFVAESGMIKTPAPVGVPLICPVAALKLKPAGRLPAP